MDATSQSNGSSQPTAEQVAGKGSSGEEQSRDSFNSNQERFVTTLAPIEEQSLASFFPGKDQVTHTSLPTYQPTALAKPQERTLMTIATELRLEIYEYLFQSQATHLLRRRDGIDDEKVIEKLTHTFDNSILFTCRKVYQEALPVFYASQTFHYSSTTGELSLITSNDESIGQRREGIPPLFSDKLHLMMNVSIDMVFHNPGSRDVMLSEHITAFAWQCPQLRNLTIHLFKYWRDYEDFSADSATGSVLRQLRPRLDSLRIIVLHSRPSKVLPNLRLSIADNECWSSKYWTGKVWYDGCPKFYQREQQWPCLTLPSLVRGRIYGWPHNFIVCMILLASVTCQSQRQMDLSARD
ncbi:hypothetical protein IMSHALPRED_006012 [Imshaugia aleurites]|uniref:Uncharacterized protein n=1 Tax=Imshaugia aleurites TaxID=172621 RepID=A0A8H3FMM1_9LECA|nr:hypothetical protein IMSHALPRED_006012 [Imshaugia aleurites]